MEIHKLTTQMEKIHLEQNKPKDTGLILDALNLESIDNLADFTKAYAQLKAKVKAAKQRKASLKAEKQEQDEKAKYPPPFLSRFFPFRLSRLALCLVSLCVSSRFVSRCLSCFSIRFSFHFFFRCSFRCSFRYFVELVCKNTNEFLKILVQQRISNSFVRAKCGNFERNKLA
jgi:hypothetical protein